MKYKKIAVFAITALLSSSALAAETSVCEVFANNMTGQFLKTVKDSHLNLDQKRAKLAGLFQQAVDTDWIGQFVLGRFWKQATDAQKKEYLSQYRTYITNNYISKIDEDTGDKIRDVKLTSLTPGEPNQFIAKSTVKMDSNEDVHVNYQLEQAAQQCHVHDIQIEGVSLVTTQRSEFQGIANNSGIDGVIKAMKKQISG